jgi:hypothetical protein
MESTKTARQSDNFSKLERADSSCTDARSNSLNCLTKYATLEHKSKICRKFFDEYKKCIKLQSEKLKADRIAARGGSRW